MEQLNTSPHKPWYRKSFFVRGLIFAIVVVIIILTVLFAHISRINQLALVLNPSALVTNAGLDQTTTLPQNAVTLAGSATDSEGSVTAYTWSEVVGGTATILNPTAPTTQINGLSEGTYTFRLTTTDNKGVTASDDVVVTVAPSTTVSVDSYGAIGDGKSHPISEWLVGGAHDRGYENLAAIKKDYAAAESLTNEIDYVATQKAFDTIPNYGKVTFTAGKTYIMDGYVEEDNKPLSVSATGATIKKAANSNYNAFIFGVKDPTKQRLEYIHWDGGTIDGNKDAIDWPGTTTMQSAFIPVGSGGSGSANEKLWNHNNNGHGNTGLLGVKYINEGVISNLTIKNSIGDGAVFDNPLVATFENCHAEGGAPFLYGNVRTVYGFGTQATYFKSWQHNNINSFPGGTVNWNNVTTTGGSIGIQASAKDENTPDNSRIVIRGGSVTDAAQNGVHIEQSRYVDIDGIVMTSTNSQLRGDFHIGNMTKYATIKNVTMTGDNIDFNNGSSLIEGDIINSTITSNHRSDENAINNATAVSGSTISSLNYGILLKPGGTVENTAITAWRDQAIVGASTIKNVKITGTGTGTAINLAPGATATVVGAHITNVGQAINVRSGATTISDSDFDAIQNNAILTDHAPSLTIQNSTFRNYGLNGNNPGPSRAAIRLNTGTSANTVTVTNSCFDHTDQKAAYTPFSIADGGNPTWTGNNVPPNASEKDFTSSCTIRSVTIPADDTTPPNVSMTMPAEDSSVSGVITVLANATDDQGGVAKVEFYKDNDNAPFATDTTNTYSATYDTTTLYNGAHTFIAKAYDEKGNTSSASVPVVISGGVDMPDTTPPTVSLTDPKGGTKISGTATLSATASDNEAVDYVDFYNGNSRLGTATAAPYTFTWDTTKVSDGAYALSAKAYDKAKNIGSSDTVAVTVSNGVTDTEKPQITSLLPADGSTVSGTITFTATVTDNVGVSRVDFYRKGHEPFASVTTPPYTAVYDTTKLDKTAYDFIADAFDAAGNEMQRTTTLTVKNSVVDTTAPSVSITSPANGARVSGTISVTATATDAVGITKVEFYKTNDRGNTVLFATDTAAPFSATYDTRSLANGVGQTFTVKAYDPSGNIGSQSVLIYSKN